MASLARRMPGTSRSSRRASQGGILRSRCGGPCAFPCPPPPPAFPFSASCLGAATAIEPTPRVETANATRSTLHCLPITARPSNRWEMRRSAARPPFASRSDMRDWPVQSHPPSQYPNICAGALSRGWSGLRRPRCGSPSTTFSGCCCRQLRHRCRLLHCWLPGSAAWHRPLSGTGSRRR